MHDLFHRHRQAGTQVGQKEHCEWWQKQMQSPAREMDSLHPAVQAECQLEEKHLCRKMPDVLVEKKKSTSLHFLATKKGNRN